MTKGSRRMKIATIAVTALLAAVSLPAFAQTQIEFGGMRQDTSLPVSVESDELSVDQGTGQAIFSGAVNVTQGDMSLTANTVEVVYATDDGPGAIEKLIARGAVTLVGGGEAAEAEMAEYTIESGQVILTGNVILTQGQNAISAERMVIDLTSGAATMDGRVRTIFQPGSK